MSRPSTDSAARLLAAGRSILAEQGFSGLSLRAVSRRAGVNLGMFSYHFKGKDDFVRQVAQGVYEEFFRGFSLEVAGEKDALAALRKALLTLAVFLRDNRAFAKALVKDLVLGNAEAKRFALANGPRHAKVLLGLLARCQKEGRLARMPKLQALPMLMASLAAPTLMAEALAAAAPKLPFNLSRRLVDQALLSDAALRQRVDLALRALRP